VGLQLVLGFNFIVTCAFGLSAYRCQVLNLVVVVAVEKKRVQEIQRKSSGSADPDDTK
jgi:hypothetical protein